MKYRLLKAGILSTSVVFSMLANAAIQTLDKVSVIVDQGVLLESEIVELVDGVKQGAVTQGQALPSDRALRTQAIERLILKSLQLQMAERMGIQISDPQLEQTINNIAERDNITIDQMRQRIESDGLTYEVYREKVREELITGEVTRANVRRRIYITPQEIETLVAMINQQGAEQEEYRLGHILIAVPSGADEEQISKSRGTAEKVVELLNTGSDFTKIAIASSSGPKALEGGDMGWMNVNSMPTLFSEAVQGQKKEILIGPLRSGAGFHVLKVLDTRGVEIVEVEEVNARHILVKPSIILSDQKAEKMLVDFRTKIIEGEEEFADLAKVHSEDPGSALKGGVLGWNDPNVYVPEFKEALSKLTKDEFSQPIRTVHGWHLIQLIERRIDDATEKRKQDRAYQLLFNRKFNEETDTWLREMRESAYIELLDKKDL
ncbi:MAG: peptidyl-prolyl cis-trans isomerase SurA [Glaciecola sp.]|jgi:peptidyl-prolyl cis-trans isomerase SurA